MDGKTEKRKIRDTSFTEQDEKEAFRRSKIITRSPPQEKNLHFKEYGGNIKRDYRDMRLEINKKSRW